MTSMMQQQQHGGGDDLTSQIVGMSKTQLYDVMTQMKTLIEKNQNQARTILIDNPSLTKSLFQAQIMLGMVRPSPVMPNISQPPSQQPQQLKHTGQQVNVQSSKFLAEPALQGPFSSSQPQQHSSKQQYASQQSMPMPSPSLPPMNFQPQSLPLHSVPSAHQINGPVNSQVASVSFPPSSQMHNPFSSTSSAQQHPHSHLQSHMPMITNQTQHSIQSGGVPHQPPLPSQPRPTSMQPFQHQHHSQIPHNMNYQFPGAPPQMPLQPLFHSGANIPGFQQGQPPLPNLPPPSHPHYMGGSHSGPEFGNQGPSPMQQVERGGSPWVPGSSDPATGGQLQGHPPPPMPGQPRSQQQQLTNEMEKALLQQVMSLTPEQINLLPPEQRQQVVQLQQILR